MEEHIKQLGVTKFRAAAHGIMLQKPSFVCHVEVLRGAIDDSEPAHVAPRYTFPSIRSCLVYSVPDFRISLFRQFCRAKSHTNLFSTCLHNPCSFYPVFLVFKLVPSPCQLLSQRIGPLRTGPPKPPELSLLPRTPRFLRVFLPRLRLLLVQGASSHAPS